MLYYCKHYGATVKPSKAVSYCLKTGCWALKICRNKADHDRLKKQNKENKALHKTCKV